MEEAVSKGTWRVQSTWDSHKPGPWNSRCLSEDGEGIPLLPIRGREVQPLETRLDCSLLKDN